MIWILTLLTCRGEGRCRSRTGVRNSHPDNVNRGVNPNEWKGDGAQKINI
ncbi:MAG TPA: hypothetical protein VMW72_22980 [Sedimentisphaerales bacterium]|nr:hypothetical protein [Sedimentisphaerales bacterium]